MRIEPSVEVTVQDDVQMEFDLPLEVGCKPT